jgi:hypothetical protein
VTRRGSWIAVAALLASGAGCDSPSTPTPAPPRTLVRPIQIESVDVVVASSPSAHVRGVIGDGCTELGGVITRRGSPNDIGITILSTRPEGAICIQIARLYDAVLVLPGDFPPGEYVLRVNSVEKTFSVPDPGARAPAG